MKLVINGFTNPKQKVEIGIPQGSSASPILILIYICEVFSAIKAKLPDITYVSFVDNLAFLTSNHSIKNVAILLEKSEKIALEWETNHLVTYDINKTEAILFSKANRPKLARQIVETRLKIGGERIFFNKETTQWLGV